MARRKDNRPQAFRALYSIAAEFDPEEGMGQVFEQMTQVFADLLAAAPDCRLNNIEAVAFMLAAMIGGSVRIVLDAAGTEENTAHIRQELPRAYVVAANEVFPVAVQNRGLA